MGLLVTGMTLLTSPSSEINLKQQIKELKYINRVEVRATCIWLFGRPIYQFGYLYLVVWETGISVWVPVSGCLGDRYIG